jgi:uncharacterized protein YjbI with pentapeptide repeats
MRKSVVLCLAFILIPAVASAQSRVNAGDILKDIDAGKAIEYRNVEITGNLDLTTIQAREVDEKSERERRRNRGSTLTYWYHVRSPLTFIDCTFNGDVIAYRHEDRKNETHNAVFHEDVSFTGCRFTGASAFKYSEFHGSADFKKTSYSEEALFKYTEFSSDVSFAGSRFDEYANFKYTEFPGTADFSDANFRSEADFKYAEFPEGVSFANTNFRRLANFKYTKFYEPFDFDGTNFEGSTDFKYTKLEGKSFTTYLLKTRNKR